MASPPLSFFDLPREIRIAVYKYVFGGCAMTIDGVKFTYTDYDLVTCPDYDDIADNSFLMTSKPSYRDAIQSFYSVREVILRGFNDPFIQYLTLKRPVLCHHVKILTIRAHSINSTGLKTLLTKARLKEISIKNFSFQGHKLETMTGYYWTANDQEEALACRKRYICRELQGNDVFKAVAMCFKDSPLDTIIRFDFMIHMYVGLPDTKEQSYEYWYCVATWKGDEEFDTELIPK